MGTVQGGDAWANEVVMDRP